MPDDAGPAHAAVLVIGNEILAGRTQDLNVAFIATELRARGIRLAEARVVGDHTAAIVAAVDALRRQYTYVFTTGGIGPTHDDITTASVAAAFGLAVVRDAQAVARLQDYYGAAELTAARLRMADVPQGAALIDNPVSAAPGFRVENVYVLPGVPRILQAMFVRLAATLAGGAPILSLSVTAWVVESALAERLAAVQTANPGVEIGSYPFARTNRLGASLVVSGSDRGAILKAGDEIEQVLRALGAEFDRGGLQ